MTDFKAPRRSTMSFNVLEGRHGSEPEWDIPLREPTHHWAVPLAVIEGTEARRVGTAFHISRLGHLFTARHCVDEALRDRDKGKQLGRRVQPVRVERDLLVVRAADDSREGAVGLHVQTVTSPEPTDIACLSTVTQDRLPQLTLPLSFAFPDVGSTVRCFGFPSDPTDKPFPNALHVVEGSVKAYFPPGFAGGFMKGPAFLIDTSVPHGMSGGPVVTESGVVCGVVSAGAEMLMNEPACLISPLYPALVIDVALHAVPTENFRINATRTFLDLCAEGYIATDGTEEMVHFRTDDDATEIGPIISKKNASAVYNSFQDYLDGRKSVPLAEPRMRLCMHKDQSREQ